MAILSRRRIPLSILLYEQFIHLTKNLLRPNITAFENLAACLSVIFELLPVFDEKYREPSGLVVE